MKTLFVCPEIRLDSDPSTIPFWAGILGAIVEKKGGDVGILDLNALRMNYDCNAVPSNVIVEEISSEKWDIVGIGGLTTTYKRIKQLAPLIRKCCPDSLFIGGGGWSTYNPDEILELIPELDLIVIGEGEETFSELYDNVSDNQTDFRGIAGLCLRETNELYFTAPRALIPDLNTIPYPSYDLFENEIYFKYSSIPMSVESYNAQRRFSVVWERGCPRGCTFCSHNGMSRIDLQNIYGSGDRLKGEKRVRKIDEEEGTFQLPARWPSPQYAVDNIKLLVDKYDCDFISIMDENMTSNLKWTEEFCTLCMDEGLDKILKWGTLGDAPSVAIKPFIIKTMQDAGCAYISFGFESASDKVLNEDIQKGQLRSHLQTVINTLKEVGMTPLTTFMIGNPNEDINDLMETVDFWIINGAEVDPFICTPYVGSPLFYHNRDYILEQYDERILLVNQGKFSVENRILKKMYLEALDKFMEDCGDATQYTATVSKNFTIPELIALKQFMYNHDVRRMLQMANQKYEETKLPQWKVSEKWKKYDPNHIAEKELTNIIESL